MNIEIDIRPNGIFVADTDIAVPCQWFAMCDRDATTMVAHPVLGNVPACERCASE